MEVGRKELKDHFSKVVETLSKHQLESVDTDLFFLYLQKTAHWQITKFFMCESGGLK